MGYISMRAALVGLGAAAGAFAAAGMISAAVAPTARADDATEIAANVAAIEAAAQEDYSAATADFALGTQAGDAAGLTAEFEGMDDDLFGVPAMYQVGDLDSHYNVPVVPATDFEYSWTDPTIAGYVAEAQSWYNTGNNLMTDAANFFATGDYTDAALDHAQSLVDYSWIPGEIEVVGTVEQMLLLLNGT
jgi:hypothetical protein